MVKNYTKAGHCITAFMEKYDTFVFEIAFAEKFHTQFTVTF